MTQQLKVKPSLKLREGSKIWDQGKLFGNTKRSSCFSVGQWKNKHIFMDNPFQVTVSHNLLKFYIHNSHQLSLWIIWSQVKLQPL